MPFLVIKSEKDKKEKKKKMGSRVRVRESAGSHSLGIVLSGLCVILELTLQNGRLWGLDNGSNSTGLLL